MKAVDEIIFESEESYLNAFLSFWTAGKENKPIEILPPSSTKVCSKCSKSFKSNEVSFYHGKPWCHACKDKFFFQGRNEMNRYLTALKGK